MTLTARDTVTGPLSNELTDSLRVQTDVVYLDGLGRTQQEVMRAASPNGNDLVKVYTYDALGRQDKAYLPYASGTNSGTFQINALTRQEAFYQTPTTGVTTINYPYSQSIFESSPLSRTVETSSPGTPWRSSVAVSYTHLTLPTISSVLVTVVTGPPDKTITT